MITTTKEEDLKTLSDEDLFELQQGFMKLHVHAKSNYEQSHRIRCLQK